MTEEKNEDFERIRLANSTIMTTDIKGKDYAQVNERIKAFRMVHPLGLIKTDIVSLENGVVTMKAIAMTEKGQLLGTGYAQEKENSSFINKTSFIENCETSAIGRALGICGFGIDTSVCSAEELQNAIANQDKPQKAEKKQEDTPEDTADAVLDMQSAMNILSDAGVNPRDEKVIDTVKKYAKVSTIDRGKLSNAELERVAKVYIQLAEEKKKKDETLSPTDEIETY